MTKQQPGDGLDDLLRGAARARPEPSEGCVDPGQITVQELVALYEGTLTGARRDAVQLHLSNCHHCRALQLDLLKHSSSAAPVEASGRGRATLIAAAAIVLCTIVGAQMLQHSSTPPEPMNWPMQLSGNMVALRSATATAEVKRFGPDSRVDFVVRPPELSQDPPLMVMRGYRLDANDLLEALAVEVERTTNLDGEVQFRVRAPAPSIFGSRAGPQSVVWALGSTTKAVSGLGGTTWRNAPRAPEVFWVRWQAIYEP